MDTSHIPKTFWHSLSFCMVIATLGLLFLAYKASTVSFEISNAKIVLSSAISQVREIKSDLETENRRLVSANQRLEEKISSLEKAGKLPKGSDLYKGLNTEIWQPSFQGPTSVMTMQSLGEKFKTLDAKIQSAEDAIKKSEKVSKAKRCRSDLKIDSEQNRDGTC